MNMEIADLQDGTGRQMTQTVNVFVIESETRHESPSATAKIIYAPTLRVSATLRTARNAKQQAGAARKPQIPPLIKSAQQTQRVLSSFHRGGRMKRCFCFTVLESGRVT